MSYGLHNEHIEAYESMMSHFNFLKSASKALKKVEEYELMLVHNDIYQVMRTDLTRRFNNTGLALVFRIIERPAEKLSPEELEKLGIINEAGQKTYKKGPRHNGGDHGELDWGEL